MCLGVKKTSPTNPTVSFYPSKPRLHELLYIEGAKEIECNRDSIALIGLTKRINQRTGGVFLLQSMFAFVFGLCRFLFGLMLDFFPAQRKSQVDLYTNAMVKELTNEEGKATGVAYINKEDRRGVCPKGKSGGTRCFGL